MGRLSVERTREEGGSVFVRRWTFDIVVRGNPEAALRLYLYEEGSKPSSRHRNLKISKRTAHGRHHPPGGDARVEAWWDATTVFSFSSGILDLRGSRGPVEPPDLPADVRAEALAAFKVSVEVPDAV